MPVWDPLRAYRMIYLIRHVEEEIARRYHDGDKMRCPTHLSIGQESVAVGVCMALEPDDWIFSHHRCHAHYLAKGGDLNRMVAELYGKASGCSGGLGGSMHLVDEAVGVMGTSAIVGSSIGPAVGAALGFALARRRPLRDSPDRITVAFLGDAGRETGILYEAFNFSVLHRLPILFVCEDNGYSTQTPLRQRQSADTDIVAIAEGFGLRKVTLFPGDDDVGTIFRMTQESRENLPAYLQVDTYRYREHVGPDYDWDMGYRSKEEVERHIQLDPLAALEKKVLQLRPDPPFSSIADWIRWQREDSAQRVAEAFAFAEASAWPVAS